MNTMFFVMTVASLILVTVVSPDSAFSIMISGASNAISLALKLCAIYAIWLSVLDVMQKVGMSRALDRLFSPITKRLFKGEDEKTREFITLNFSANLLGMGSAATPLGIKAMEGMQDGSDKATDNMILFMVVNATSIQLLPATIIGLRSSYGSASASDIILPSLIATAVSTVCGVLLAKAFSLTSKNRKKDAPALPQPLKGAKLK
ncbi:MAG TPA: hypothetical protein IAB11_03390 [Candidatus Ornithoclostridium faecavium]|nr:hypothetical protein [Candidatus Ornithoclostridium faecavium]